MLAKQYRFLQRIAFVTGFTGILLIGITIPFTGCTYSSEEVNNAQIIQTASDTETIEQDALDKSIEAHGGLERWRSFGSLEYTLQKRGRTEHHLIDLHTRSTLQKGEAFQIGYNGTDVWVSPGLDAYSGNPRFVAGLDFYFFGIPFVLADPGTHREYLGRMMIDDQEYEAVKISFDEGVGASSDDYYIVHLDPETYQLKILLYTATFNTQEPSDNFYARVYADWQNVEGLLLPTKMVSHQWDAEQRKLGTPRGEAIFLDITLKTERPATSVFAPPEESEIAG